MWDEASEVSGPSEFPLGSRRGRQVRGDAFSPLSLAEGTSPGEVRELGKRLCLWCMFTDPRVQFLVRVSHRSGALCVGIASAVYHCSPLPAPRFVPGWVLHGEPRQRNFFLYTAGVNQHFGKCNYRFASCGNLWVSHTWSAWSSAVAQLFH